MTTMQKRAVMWVCALALVGCGGGGGSAGTSVFGGASAPTSTSAAASIDVIASAITVPSGGDQVTVTATVKDANNVGLAGTSVKFASDSGTLTAATAATDASGVATATLSSGANRSNRSIAVTVTSGSAVGTLTLPVVGTTLSYSGVTTVALGGTAQTTVTATDSKGTAIAGLAITAASSLNNALSNATLTTDAQGTATIGYTATNAGTDKLTLTGGGTTLATNITISSANFAFTSPAANTTVPVSTIRQAVTVTYLSNGVAQAGKTVTFAATAGILTVADFTATSPCLSATVKSTATTDLAGKASVCVSSTTASPATVQATLTGVTGVTAQASLPIAFVATTPSKLVLQVTPSSLSPSSSASTSQKASVIATVTDANANPVAGVIVDFNRCVDPSGGSLSQASAVTNSGGQATVQYVAGPTSTASNGVLLQAAVEGFPAITLPACSAAASNATNNTASLTVNQNALFIALGTGNTLLEPDKQTNQQDWTVYVTDSNGVAVSNVAVTVKLLPVLYGKGYLYFGKSWNWSAAPLLPAAIDPVSQERIGITGPTENDYVCPNEDLNYNGVLDPGEDKNLDGILEPGNVISIATSTGSGSSTGTVTTGSNGRATVSVVYAKSYSKWLKVKLIASAIVSGTESSTQSVFWTLGAVPDYAVETTAPPGQQSPFGVNSCTTPH